MADKTDYYRKVYEAKGRDVFKVMTAEDIAVVSNLTRKDQQLFIEDQTVVTAS